MARSATERKRDQRERDKKTEAERLALMLSRSIKLDLFKATDAALIRCMARTGIDEPQDYISRLIHSADLLNDNDLERMTRLPQ